MLLGRRRRRLLKWGEGPDSESERDVSLWMREGVCMCSASPESARGVASSVLGAVVKVRVKSRWKCLCKGDEERAAAASTGLVWSGRGRARAGCVWAEGRTVRHA